MNEESDRAAEAWWRIDAGYPREALDALRDADPNDPGVAYTRASALASLGRHEEAEDVARRALEHDPENVALLEALTAAQLATDPAAAQATAERALQLAPENPRLLALNVLILLQRKRLDAAERVLARLTQIAPGDEVTRRARTMFLMRWGSEPGTHCDAADELLRHEPDDAFAHYLKGVAELPERWWVGLRHLRQSAALAPHDPLLVETARVMRSWLVRPVHLIGTPPYYVAFFVAFAAILVVDMDQTLLLLGIHFAAMICKGLVLGIARRVIDGRVARALRDA